MTLCLALRDSGQMVEVDLDVQRRCRNGQDIYFLRFVDEHELGWDKD